MSEPTFGTWQPIETAPKDGTDILIWVETAHGDGPSFALAAYWQSGMWECCGAGFFHPVTHWMPLPLAPEATP